MATAIFLTGTSCPQLTISLGTSQTKTYGAARMFLAVAKLATQEGPSLKEQSKSVIATAHDLHSLY